MDLNKKILKRLRKDFFLNPSGNNVDILIHDEKRNVKKLFNYIN